MIPPFPGSSLPLSEAPYVQPIHANTFPIVEFSEPPTETPLDLNFSQRSPQNTPRAQSEADAIPPKSLEASGGLQQQELVTPVGPVNEAPASHASGSGTGGCKAKGSNTSASRTRAGQKTSFHWSHAELIALFDAKKAQAEKAESGPRKLRSATPGKWEEIATTCKKLGISKTAAQCREKWERLWPPFRLILDWESKLSEKKSSYWVMTEEERVQGGFPGLFDKEVYDAMAERYLFVMSLNEASPIFNSLNVDSGAAGSFKEQDPVVDVGDEVGQNRVDGAAAGQAVAENQQHRASGRKRKPSESTKKTTPKQIPSETNKKAPILLDPKEEAFTNVVASPLRETGSNKGKVPMDPLEITERRLLVEEKKLRLAEQRFSLEERKLEATIEIGKSLIASMERMTGTISGLSSTPAQQQ